MSPLSPMNAYGSEPDQVSALINALKSTEPSFLGTLFLDEERASAFAHLRPFVMVQMGWGNSKEALNQLDHFTMTGDRHGIPVNAYAWRSLTRHADYINRLSMALERAPGRTSSAVRSDLDKHLRQLARDSDVVTSTAIIALANPAVAKWLKCRSESPRRPRAVDFGAEQVQASALIQKLSPIAGHPNDFETQTIQGRVGIALRLVELLGESRAEARAVGTFLGDCHRRARELDAKGAAESGPFSRMTTYLKTMTTSPNKTLDGIRYTGDTNELVPYAATSQQVSAEIQALRHVVEIAASCPGSQLSEWIIEAARADVEAARSSHEERAAFRAAAWLASGIENVPRADDTYLEVGLDEPPGKPSRLRPEQFSTKLKRLLFTAPTDVDAADELAELASREGVEIHGLARLLSSSTLIHGTPRADQSSNSRLKAAVQRVGRRLKQRGVEADRTLPPASDSLPDVDADCRAMLIGYAEHLFRLKHPPVRTGSEAEPPAELISVNGVDRPADEVRKLLVQTVEKHIFAGGADISLGLDAAMRRALGPLRTNAVRSAAGTEVVLSDLMFSAALRQQDENATQDDKPASFSGRSMPRLAGFLLHRRGRVTADALNKVQAIVGAATDHVFTRDTRTENAVDIDVVELARRMRRTKVAHDDWSPFGTTTRNTQHTPATSPASSGRPKPASGRVPLRLATSSDGEQDVQQVKQELIASPSLVANRRGKDLAEHEPRASQSELSSSGDLRATTAGRDSTTDAAPDVPEFGDPARHDGLSDGLTAL